MGPCQSFRRTGRGKVQYHGLLREGRCAGAFPSSATESSNKQQLERGEGVLASSHTLGSPQSTSVLPATRT